MVADAFRQSGSHTPQPQSHLAPSLYLPDPHVQFSGSVPVAWPEIHSDSASYLSDSPMLVQSSCGRASQLNGESRTVWPGLAYAFHLSDAFIDSAAPTARADSTTNPTYEIGRAISAAP